MTDLLLAFAMGVIFVGSTASRTLQIVDGKVAATAIYGVIVSITYYFMIRYAISGKLEEYVAFSFGTILVTAWLAKRRKK